MNDYRNKLNNIFKSDTLKPSISKLYIEDKYDIETEMRPRNAPAAPVAPTRPTTTPSRPDTKPSTKPSIFPKPRPGTLPQPRASKVKERAFYLLEAYEQFVNPRTQRLFNQGNARFGFTNHPLIRQHGEALARQAYGHSSDKLYRTMAELQDMSPQEKQQHLFNVTGNALQQMMRIEREHKEELEQLAIDVVSKVYNLSEEDKERLNAHLRRPQLPSQASDDQGDDDDQDEDHGDLTDEVNKRYTMNLLSQGAAIHNMHDMHLEDEIQSRLSEIDDRLVSLYSQFGRGSSHMYWLYDINMMLNANLGQAMGTAHFDEEGNIHAQAPVFPVLVQELVKGVIMLLSHHQFEEMPQGRAKAILRAADTLQDEFPQIMIGPKVWKAFIIAIPSEYRNRLTEVVAQLAKAHPRELHEIMVRLGDAIVNNEDPKTSPAASALRDLLERTLKVETPEDVSGYLDD